jgi:7,8-dihydropterin-6-yl-methyl-4-(beta-D-ribofuranosyl)aminobenzene 5'-phosphate synthase
MKRSRYGLSRREFLRLAGLAVSGAALEACSPSAPVVITATPSGSTRPLTISVVYNNIGADERLRTEWGFSALVEYSDQTLLFDTGGDAPTLLHNMDQLDIDVNSIQTILLSHIHWDHVDGLQGLLDTGIQPTVYLPPSFPDDFKRQVAEAAELVEVTPGQAVGERMFSTGELATPGHPELMEQALVIETGTGLIVITGCAHPGIVNIARRAGELFEGEIYLTMGGFHLGGETDSAITAILADLRELGVQRVSPSHCTGEHAIARFAEEYGDDFIGTGAGSMLYLQG